MCNDLYYFELTIQFATSRLNNTDVLHVNGGYSAQCDADGSHGQTKYQQTSSYGAPPPNFIAFCAKDE